MIYNTIRTCSFCILLLVSLCIGACSSATQQSKLQHDIEQLNDEIMQYHDAAMPKMGKVLTLRKQINRQIDTCEDEMLKYSLQQASYLLTKADKDMMSWMHQYETPAVHDSALHYLAGQREQIKKIHDDIFNSIKNAESIIGTKN